MLKEWIKSIGIALVVAFIIRQFIFSPIVVDGESMMPTLHDKERMIVDKVFYKVDNLERFDIVVFKHDNKQLIKRIIGLPGDSIEYKNDKLYINKTFYKEPYLSQYKKDLSKGKLLTYDFDLENLSTTKMTTVPEGYVFVMGDNRLYSNDSRLFGFVSMENIIGRTSLVYYPISDIRMQH
ncbi:MAG: signal peptidase I [Bacillaceae bacterium]